jgi:hypothetical protein
MRSTERNLTNVANVTDSLASIRQAVNLLTRLILVYRSHVSRQEICQLVSITESKRYDTIAIKASLMPGQQPNPVDLEIDKHTLTLCFSLFQNEALSQLESAGFHAFFFSFSLEPMMVCTHSHIYIQGYPRTRDRPLPLHENRKIHKDYFPRG